MPDFVAEQLATGEHPHLITAVKAAQDWGCPPSFMLTGDKEWSDRDRLFAVGYQLYQQMLCPECGQPLTVCRDASSDGWFDVETSTCYATKAVQEHTSEEGYKPSPGGILYPVLSKKEGDAPAYGAPPEGW